MWYIYTIEHYSAIKSNDIMKFLGKWILAPKLRIPKTQFIHYIKLKKKEDQSMDASVLLKMGN